MTWFGRREEAMPDAGLWVEEAARFEVEAKKPEEEATQAEEEGI